MATKKGGSAAAKRSKKPKAKPAAAVEQPAGRADKPVDLVVLGEMFDRIASEFGFGTPYDRQTKRVELLQAELEVEREKLAHLGGPLIEVAKLLQPEALRRVAGSKPYDHALKLECAKIKLVGRKRYGADTGQATGARPWKELRESGASDEQICKNLSSLTVDAWSTTNRGQFKLTTSEFARRVRPGEYGSPEMKLIKGRASVIAEVRRVMGIGQPVKAPSKKKPKRTKKEISAGVAEQLGMGTAAGGTAAVMQPAASNGADKKNPGAIDILRELSAATTPELAQRIGKSVNATGALMRRLEKKGLVRKCTVPGKPGGSAGYEAVDPAKTAAGKPLNRDDERVFDRLNVFGPSDAATLASDWNVVEEEVRLAIDRLVEAGRVKKSGRIFMVLAADEKTKAEDAAVNADFEQELRNRGKKRNQVRKDFANEEPIDEELAGEKALAEEREMTDQWIERAGGGGPVVVDRKARQGTKGVVRKERPAPFGGKPR